jgi:hypothetical protein
MIKPIRYPQIQFDSYIEALATKPYVCVPKDKTEINVCISGGGMASMYSSGLLTFLYYLEKHDKITVKHVYGTSAGAISGFFYLLLVYNQTIGYTELNVSRFISDINNNVKDKYAKHPYVIDNWMEYIQENIPVDFYKYCSNKLFITFHVIEYGCLFIQKTVSVYTSNEHLINIIRCSGTIPYITIPNIATRLYNTTQYAYDGIYPQVVDNSRWTLYVNMLYHNYSLTKRISICDKSYEPLFIEGVYDIYHFYSGMKADKENKGVIYYYKKQIGKSSLTNNNNNNNNNNIIIENNIKTKNRGNIVNYMFTGLTVLYYLL